jgi:hypothetical protein
MTLRPDGAYDVKCVDGRVQQGVPPSYLRNGYVCIAAGQIGGRRCSTNRQCSDGFQCVGQPGVERCLPDQLPIGAACSSSLQCTTYYCTGDQWGPGTCQKSTWSGGFPSGGGSSGSSGSSSGSSGGGEYYYCPYVHSDAGGAHSSGIYITATSLADATEQLRQYLVGLGGSNAGFIADNCYLHPNHLHDPTWHH